MFTCLQMEDNYPIGALPPARTTPDLIADELRTRIARGEPPPGGALRQEDLAARFGVSRIPVREALRRLEAEGLVIVHPNRGAYVSRFSAAQVREIYELRVLLESDLLVRALARMTSDDLRVIESRMLAAEKRARESQWGELDDLFHAALYAPAQRPRHLAMVMALRGTVRHYRNAHSELPKNTKQWLRDHRAILAACRSGHGKSARRRLQVHLERAGQVVVNRLAEAERRKRARSD